MKNQGELEYKLQPDHHGPGFDPLPGHQKQVYPEKLNAAGYSQFHH